MGHGTRDLRWNASFRSGLMPSAAATPEARETFTAEPSNSLNAPAGSLVILPKAAAPVHRCPNHQDFSGDATTVDWAVEAVNHRQSRHESTLTIGLEFEFGSSDYAWNAINVMFAV